MADGTTKRIEQVQAGDRVLSAEEKSGKQSTQRVVRTFVKQAPGLYRIETEARQSVEATGEHPFWVEGKGFVAARRLARSDLLVDAEGRESAVRRVVWVPGASCRPQSTGVELPRGAPLRRRGP